MAFEIERKYLVINDSYRAMAHAYKHICQGYLSRDPERTVRVRISDNQAFLTIKGKTLGAVRKEFEYAVPLEDGQELLMLCGGDIIDKTRFLVSYEGMLWEVDEFHGRLEGLKLAEIELPESNAAYQLPPFAGEDVTGDSRFYNSNL